MDKKHTDSALIDLLGGTGAVARECEISDQAVSQWRENGIPHAWKKYFLLRFPDVFPKRSKRAEQKAA